VLAISSRGLASLRADQVAAIEKSCRILPLDVPTIELAGGSVRCMLAGIHLDARPTRVPSPNVHTPSHLSGPSVHTSSHLSGPVIHRGMPLG
jgi:hypothetical protein